MCVDGVCVSRCNPACGAGDVCDSVNWEARCVPVSETGLAKERHEAPMPDPTGLFMIRGILLPAGDFQYEEDGRPSSMDFDIDVSGGIGVVAEHYMLRNLAFGFAFEYISLVAPVGDTTINDGHTTVSVELAYHVLTASPVLRAALPLLNNRAELYCRLEMGMTVFIPAWGITGEMYGLNIKVLPGFMYALNPNFIVFAEMGFTYYKTWGSLEDNDSGSLSNKLFQMNVSVGYRW